MLRNRPPCAPCLSRSIAAKRTGRGRSPACAGAGSADAGGAARRGDRRGSGGAYQHGAQLAGLLPAWPSGGTAAAPETGTAGHDRAARWSDRGGDPERRHAPRRRLDAAAPVRRDRPARRAGDLAAVAVAPIAPKGFAWRRPRHTLKGRQDAAAVAASHQRLADLKTQAAAGTIDLVFLDESEALTHPYLARCWARRGTELGIQAPGQAKNKPCSALSIRCVGTFSSIPARPSAPPTLLPCSTNSAPHTAALNEPGRWSRCSTTGRS